MIGIVISWLFLAVAYCTGAEVVVYASDFDAMDGESSLSGQDTWTTSDPDVGLGYGAADGIATLVIPGSGATQAGFLGGFFRSVFPPGKTEVFLWPPVTILGSTVTFQADIVLIGSDSTGPFSANDVFGWTIRNGAGTNLFRLLFEPTSTFEDRREIVYVDHAGARHSSGSDLFLGSLYSIRITIRPEPAGDRLIASIADSFSTVVVSDLLIPSGSIGDTAEIAANWKMSNASVDHLTGIVSGFGSNFMAFDNYRVETTHENAVHVAGVTIPEDGGVARLTATICEPLASDLEVFYDTADGDALAGTDYMPANSSSEPLIIPAGGMTGTVDIPILEDGLAESNEWFRVNLTGTDGTTVVASPEITIHIADNDDPDGDGIATEWELLHGLDPDDPSDAIGDLDDDGTINLLEYALGLHPTTSDLTGLPSLASDPANLTFTYVRNSAFTKLAYRVESSVDLVNWTPVPDVLVSTDGPMETRQATIPRSANRTYLRLSVEVID